MQNALRPSFASWCDCHESVGRRLAFDRRLPARRANAVSAVAEFYGRWAGLYDHVARFPGVGAWRERAAHSLDLTPGETVVEMGCGTGANLRYLRERIGPEGTIVGVDLTPGMLALARRRVVREGWETVGLVFADAARPPIDGADAVLASFVVGMFDDPAGVVETWIELLRPDGRICLLDATRSSHPAARPLDLAFRAFVIASTPPTWKVRYDEPPWEPLDRRVEAAHAALSDACTDVRRSTHALGFVRLTRGRVP